jgi:hypothetical protein
LSFSIVLPCTKIFFGSLFIWVKVNPARGCCFFGQKIVTISSICSPFAITTIVFSNDLKRFLVVTLPNGSIALIPPLLSKQISIVLFHEFKNYILVLK